jgi:type 1 glutamine amidotransferase
VAVLVAAAVGAGFIWAQTPDPPRILVFTKTGGYRHASIPDAIQAFRALGSQNGFEVDATEDGGFFTDTTLARYDAVAFVLTTADVLDPAQQAAFERYIRAGHGFVGVHSAADTERDWPWYGRLVGAWSSGHPEIQDAVIDVAAARDGSTTHLPARWQRNDEWYGFLTNPRGSVRVLLALDESTYLPREWSMGADHPIAWAQEFDGGRAWYTAGGHTEASYSEPLFRQHLAGGINYAIGDRKAATTTVPTVAKGPPRIVGVSTAVLGRRVTLTVRHKNCTRCSAQVRVRSASVKLKIFGATATGSAKLPAGRTQLTIIVKDGATGRTATMRRWVRAR